MRDAPVLAKQMLAGVQSPLVLPNFYNVQVLQ